VLEVLQLEVAPCSRITVSSDTQIRATVPAGATKENIGVTNAVRTGNSASNFTVNLLANPGFELY
jgi:hypothetical protein